MSDQQPPQQRNPNQRRRRGGGGGQRTQNRNDLWRLAPTPDAPAPIQPAPDAKAFIVSLGAPALRGGHMAEHYIAAVVERAATLATALAASADLLADSTD